MFGEKERGEKKKMSKINKITQEEDVMPEPEWGAWNRVPPVWGHLGHLSQSGKATEG